MPTVAELLDLEARRKLGQVAGELDEIESVAASLLPERRHDVVACWPGEKLGELLEARPDLEAEILERRGGELTQL